MEEERTRLNSLCESSITLMSKSKTLKDEHQLEAKILSKILANQIWKNIKKRLSTLTKWGLFQERKVGLTPKSINVKNKQITCIL